MSSFWHWYITIGSIGYIVAIVWLLQVTRKTKSDETTTDELMDHSYDGIQEYNNPMPRWWIQLFYITIIFSIGYLVLYPGLGNWKGTLGWTQQNQHEAELAKANEIYNPIFEKYGAISIPQLVAEEPKAIEMGKRIFLNNCAVCHGSDAGGVAGFPNLRDKDWLWGGSPDKIVESISNGRTGTMPAWGGSLDELSLQQVTSYVFSLSGRKADKDLAEAGKATFQMYCVACHGAEGKGMDILGAPNLTDNIWLYGGSPATVTKTIREGRSGSMPAHADLLSKDKIHLVAAYIYGLSNTVVEIK